MNSSSTLILIRNSYHIIFERLHEITRQHHLNLGSSTKRNTITVLGKERGKDKKKEYVLQVAQRMSPSTVQTEGMLAWALQ